MIELELLVALLFTIFSFETRRMVSGTFGAIIFTLLLLAYIGGASRSIMQ